MSNNNRFLTEIHSQMAKIDLAHMETISAEPKSLYSNISVSDTSNWQLCIQKSTRENPSELIALLVLVSKVKPFWYQEFILFCAEQSRKKNYQGKWRVLHKLAKLNLHNLICYRITEIMSPNDFFGNYLPIIKKFARNCPCNYLNQKLPKPKYPQRKRGYNDKGSVKFSHEVHDLSRHTGPNPVREDYRSQYKKRSSILNFLYG